MIRVWLARSWLCKLKSRGNSPFDILTLQVTGCVLMLIRDLGVEFMVRSCDAKTHIMQVTSTRYAGCTDYTPPSIGRGSDESYDP
jgi:hypothetical protein